MGKINLDKIISIDLEATCWETKEEQGNQISEIIEIGACFLNVKTGEVSNKTSYIIKPRRSTISAFCEKLTTLTQEQVNKGIPFGDACNKLRNEFGTTNRVWASYGNYDRKQFERDCSSLGIKYPFGQNHINVKNLFALRNKLGFEVGLSEAINMLGFKFEGTHHRGCDDAFNTAKVLREILK